MHSPKSVLVARKKIFLLSRPAKIFVTALLAPPLAFCVLGPLAAHAALDPVLSACALGVFGGPLAWLWLRPAPNSKRAYKVVRSAGQGDASASAVQANLYAGNAFLDPDAPHAAWLHPRNCLLPGNVWNVDE
jgi:hypothetical protein